MLMLFVSDGIRKFEAAKLRADKFQNLGILGLCAERDFRRAQRFTVAALQNAYPKRAFEENSYAMVSNIALLPSVTSCIREADNPGRGRLLVTCVTHGLPTAPCFSSRNHMFIVSLKICLYNRFRHKTGEKTRICETIYRKSRNARYSACDESMFVRER